MRVPAGRPVTDVVYVPDGKYVTVAILVTLLADTSAVHILVPSKAIP
jgi:hypothetical protein